MQLTLLVPELIWPEPDDPQVFAGLDTPALNTLLARSKANFRPARAFEAALAEAFGHAENAAYAAFRRLGEASLHPEANTAGWLCSDPIHLRFHQEHLVLADSRCLDIAVEEAEALVDALNEHFQGIAHFQIASAGRWYVQLAEEPPPESFDTLPQSAVAGRRIERLLPEGEQARPLRQLFTEAQMLLHSHPANRQRETAGKLPINGLWLWGGGTLPPQHKADLATLWSDNPLAIGLARAAGVPEQPLPGNAANFLKKATANGHHLIVLEDLQEAVHYEKTEAFSAAVNALEQHWFAPLRAALAQGKITQLRIETTTAYGTLRWQSSRTDQWKLWRSRQTLGEIARNLAKAPQ